MQLGLYGRHALVLGATSGIGRAVAYRLVAEGAALVVQGSDRSRVATLVEELGDGAVVKPVVADIRTEKGRAGLIDEVDAATSILVAVGHGTEWGPLESFSDDGLQGQLVEKPLSELAVIRQLLPTLATHRWARVVMIGGAEAAHAVPDYAAGMLSAALIRSAVKSLAVDHSASGTTFNAVHPGPTRTKRTEEFVEWSAQRRGSEGYDLAQHLARHEAASATGRITTADEVASLVLYLCSDLAGQITGQSLVVDGGAGRAI